MSGKKYTGPLPKSKPTAFERWKGERSVNKPTTTEDQDRISKRMAEKFKKSPKAQRYEEGGNVISDADLSRLKRTMEITPEMSKRIREIEESGKTFPPKRKPNKPISEKDLEKIKKLMKPVNFEGGGEVRGMGRAYQGKKRGCKIR